MKRSLSILIAFFIFVSTFYSNSSIAFATNEKPTLTSDYAVLMDYETGEILYDKNGNSKLYPASTTKAWTAYLVIKHASDLNDVITIENLPPIEGSSMYLKNGESFTVKQLLQSLLVHSSNDVAYVLANYISGSVEEFAKLMNQEAKDIGAKNTHFNNPHGLPDKEHYTTAYDMALMARKAMSNNIFRDIVSMESVQFEPTDTYPYERYFINTNKFLTSNEKINYKGKEIEIKYDIVDGIKTGYTDDAGRCLLSSAVKDGRRLISAVFKSYANDLYLDSRTLLDYGFDNFYSTTIVNKKDFISSKDIFFSKQGKLTYEPKSNYNIILPVDSKGEKFTKDIILNEIDLPIKKGDKVGYLEVYDSNNKLETKIALIAKEDVDSVFTLIKEQFLNLSLIKILLLIISIIILSTIIVIIVKRNRKKNNQSIYTNKRSTFRRRR